MFVVQAYVYAGVPPETVRSIAPVAAPEQSTCVTLAVAVSAGGACTVNEPLSTVVTVPLAVCVEI